MGGFKIAKTGSGSEREIVWNGKKLGSGDFTLTDKRFTTTQTLSNGKSLTTTITWKNRWDSPNFLLDYKVHVNLDGTERKLDLNLDWGMSKLPDMDLNTPETATSRCPPWARTPGGATTASTGICSGVPQAGGFPSTSPVMPSSALGPSPPHLQSRRR